MGKKLFVGNLSFSTTDAELREHFAKAGNCESASVLMDRITGRSRGFGFVEMSTSEDAERAIAQLNGSELQGRTLNVSEARERGERGPLRSRPPGGFTFQGETGGPRPPKNGGSRRGLRARKRSL